jgi:anhydro-N-acetylmuramic acid kinase
MYFIGLMSGTSADGIDAALVDIGADSKTVLVATYHTPYPAEVLQDLTVLSEADQGEYPKLEELDRQLGVLFADAVNRLLQVSGIDKSEISAIGSHGHTVRHEPDAADPFSLQIGMASVIAEQTGIVTVADFRTSDIAVGGQGAPLVPAFHQAAFSSRNTNRTICNIGGIANVTYLPADKSQPVLGFDTGPGNTLMDHWIKQQKDLDFDANGDWASQGERHDLLLNALMADAYFDQPPPKSTGKEHFNLHWVATIVETLSTEFKPIDVQATLAMLTATSIAKAISDFLSGTQEIYLCGGGCKNRHLVSLLKELCSPLPIDDTSALGVDPDWVEAVAFAWLAKQTLEGKPGNLPSVTGARSAVPLGKVFVA